jgi:hypothetical protein
VKEYKDDEKVRILWNVTSRGLTEAYRRFGGMYFPHIQG